ncbi:DeoR family transcriptional regulator [Novipirellula sp.]|uniref:DeoR family transcriptional regulator n=1 Tax=Novipirellula sp. TaxID=2795430 RepID=UPI00356457E2
MRILKRIAARGYIESLAASLGVSEKTVRRDIAGLRQLGIASKTAKRLPLSTSRLDRPSRSATICDRKNRGDP